MPPSLVELFHTLSNKKKLVPAWVLCCVVATATMICGSIIVGWELRISDLKGSSPRPSTTRSVLFELDLIGLDLPQNVVTFDWRIIGDDCTDSGAASCPVVNIFVNADDSPNRAEGSTTPSDDAASQPVFQHNPATLSLSGQRSRPAFRTQLGLRSFPIPDQPNLVEYPFDKYAAAATVFALANDTGEAVGAWIFNVTGAAFGFATTLGEVDIDSNGVMSVDFHIRRAMSVRLYVITIILGMWLISLGLMAITIKALVFRHEIEAAVLVLPVGTVIAFGQLRRSLPGSPVEFGATIDIMGSMPNFVCLVLTSVFALAYCLTIPNPKPTEQREDSIKNSVDSIA